MILSHFPNLSVLQCVSVYINLWGGIMVVEIILFIARSILFSSSPQNYSLANAIGYTDWESG